MCGIVGIAGLNPLEPVDETRLKIMRDVLRHRGPDGEGLWTEGPVGLGFRRLAIIDVQGGAQPMPNEDGSVWVIFNGEIYNHAKLRPWLEARGHQYRTRADTETIVHLYEEVGERCVEQVHTNSSLVPTARGCIRGSSSPRRARSASILTRPPLFRVETPFGCTASWAIQLPIEARRAWMARGDTPSRRAASPVDCVSESTTRTAISSAVRPMSLSGAPSINARRTACSNTSSRHAGVSSIVCPKR